MNVMYTFESYIMNNVLKDKEDKFYYFSTENFNYRLGIQKGYNDYYYVGFRAKHKDSNEPYSTNIITNENPYKLMKFIFEIIIDFYNDLVKELDNLKRFYKNIKINDIFKGFKFSLTGEENKSKQRLILYNRMLPEGWNIEYDNENNQYIINV